MIITYTGSKDRDTYSKISAIKTIRNHCGLGLKEAKEAVERIVDNGSEEVHRVAHMVPAVDILVFNEQMKHCGDFDVKSTLTELTNTIEKAIEMAVNCKEYKTARSLINTLPSSMRADHMTQD